jgi:hypothetical protein
MTSSSPTLGAIKKADSKIPEMSNFFKKTTITDDERQAYHGFCWLTGNLISTIPEVDVPTIHGSTILCFKSHLITGLGLPPNKFHAAIMNFLGCELVHFNPNAIAALNCFTMLCECWLGITLDTSLFWYYYSQPGTIKWYMTESGCLCAAIIKRSTLRLASRAARKTLRKDGSCWICMSNRSG